MIKFNFIVKLTAHERWAMALSQNDVVEKENCCSGKHSECKMKCLSHKQLRYDIFCFENDPKRSLREGEGGGLRVVI